MTGISQSPFQLVPCSPCIGRDLTKHSQAVPSTPDTTDRNPQESPLVDLASRGVPGTPVPQSTVHAQISQATPSMDSGEQIVPRVTTPISGGFRIPTFRTPQERSKPSLRRANQRRRIENLNRSPPRTREIDLFNGEDIFE
ncbi:uncharacterized protein LOC105440661 [Strongylocentrotus purpuratus]|uniref:Uncharacterized protein n=1 Tax=Strongylocentrotus purpuratus TaxID=7668 RepID=A0A7M7HN88_STRPU|nr:uncharacterized protein LOC105440661 [Strongylocentrotus purpuratus]|eukprot:XP_011669425.1 PREDICTED: uncharacterized protein LOC105440661 [Strongylocentrotus purpuratus]